MERSPSVPSSEPQISLGVLLLVSYRHMEQRILNSVVAAGYPITMAQARLFQRIDHAGSRLTRLAEAAQVTKQTAGFLVDQLEAGGYVARVVDPSDGRARLVRITARGNQVVTVASAEHDRIQAEWTDHLGTQDTDELRRILEHLREITDPYS